MSEVSTEEKTLPVVLPVTQRSRFWLVDSLITKAETETRQRHTSPFVWKQAEVWQEVALTTWTRLTTTSAVLHKDDGCKHLKSRTVLDRSIVWRIFGALRNDNIKTFSELEDFNRTCMTLIDFDVCYAEYAKCLQTGTGTRGTTGTTRSETWGFANSVIRQDSEFQCGWEGEKAMFRSRTWPMSDEVSQVSHVLDFFG